MDNKYSLTILLAIEDDPLVRQALSSYLEGFGYRVLQATDGEEGLGLFHEALPDLVLTDLRLPKIDGMEVLAEIRKTAPETPVIIVSGMGTQEDTIKALQLGAQDYITKPIADMALIRHAVDKALERAALVRENRHYQQHLEEEVQLKTAELHQAQKLEAIGTLAGGIAHDFNNILASIMGFTELALLKVEQEEELKDDLLQIKKASLRAKNLILQILTFSRRSTTTRQPVTAATIIKETLKLLQATLPATVDLQQHIQADQACILADPTELHQIVTNLCTNAFHALPGEQGVIRIELKAHQITEEERKWHPELNEQLYLRLRVSDSGSGMEPAILQNIFNPFFTTKGKGQGTGLGLSVVHGIVKDCNGSIRVESTSGKGTTFTLLFPLLNAKSRAQEGDTVVPNLPRGKEQILFVDDEKDLRALASRMLTYLGYSVVCCASGSEALEKLTGKTISFDLVITDQSMPGMPGTELAQQIRLLTLNLPILLCTGYSSMVNKQKANKLGINSFLQKPLSISLLAQEIRKLLDSKYPYPPESTRTEITGK